jgi:Cu+-exporting ATPase
MFTSSISVEGLQSLIGGKDPVCGKDVQPTSAAASVVHGDKTNYFCSIECNDNFEAEPEKFGACC